MGSLTSKKLALIFTFITYVNVSTALAEDENGGFNLADAFAQTEEKQTEQIAEVTEVEPIVVGRKKWNEKLNNNISNICITSINTNTICFVS